MTLSAAPRFDDRLEPVVRLILAGDGIISSDRQSSMD